jgi:hypothetical protein
MPGRRATVTADPPGPIGRRAGTGAVGQLPSAGMREHSGPGKSWRSVLEPTTGHRSRLSVRSVLSFGSYGSLLSFGSALSVLSCTSVGSLLSINSAGSILSINSAGSILSINSAGSILSSGSAGSILSRRSAGSILSSEAVGGRPDGAGGTTDDGDHAASDGDLAVVHAIGSADDDSRRVRWPAAHRRRPPRPL